MVSDFYLEPGQELHLLGLRHETDKVAHGYLPHYHNHFTPLRNQPITLLEVGAWKGGSLRMWRDWFKNPDTRIMSVDIGHGPCPLDPEKYELIVADIKSWVPPEGLELDIVIDDGSHMTPDMVAAFRKLWPLVKPGGWYVIEDLETQFQPGWGHFERDGSEVIDQIVRAVKGALRERLAESAVGNLVDASEVSEVHVYRQIAFLRKAK